MLRLKTLSRLIVAAALLGAQIFACSRSPSATRDSVGSVELALSQPSAIGIDVVTYVISGNGIPPIGGAIDVTTSTSATALVGGIPANPNPYLVAMDAVSRDGRTTCHGQGSFTVGTGGVGTGGVGIGGNGSVGNGAGGFGIGGSGGTCVEISSGDPVACPQCTTDNCSLAPAPDGTDGCCALPLPDDQNLCRVAVACFSAFGCTVGGDALRCFCGNSGAACFAIPGAASGPCVNEVVAAAKTRNPAAIRPQFTSIASPLGRAVNLMGCRGAFCSVECAVP